MSGSTEDLARNTEVRPFMVQIPEAALEALRARDRSDALALERTGRRPVPRGPVGDHPGASSLLGDRLRLAPVPGEAEHAASVQDRDRRGGHPLHPREVTTRRTRCR